MEKHPPHTAHGERKERIFSLPAIGAIPVYCRLWAGWGFRLGRSPSFFLFAKWIDHSVRGAAWEEREGEREREREKK